ncbi:MAG TPA: peptidylprolyl isomerase, partial [Gemmatimonadales bacterium]|nr:peptidylprolyl isomerase [Gemmatimonadales bacterium]
GVRIYALLALGTWRDSSLAPYALARLDDSVVNVRVQAATALGGLGGAQAVAALLAARRDAPAWALRREALLALARADSTAFQTAAADWAASLDWRERAAAAEGWAVTRPGEPGWRDDPDGRVVAAALQAWSSEVPGIDPALLAAARALIGHPDAGVRSVAADILARAADPADLPALAAAWHAADQDSFPEAAQSALGALAAIAARSDTAAALVERRFLAATSAPPSYLLRRWAAERWPAAAARWGRALPLETRRGSAEYRDIVRRRRLGAPAGRRPRARFETDGAGTFEVELLGDEAPLTVEHFVTLARSGFFDGHRWHRVVPNFVVQDGDPRGDGWGGPPLPRGPRHAYAIRDEINRVRYAGPVLGMALSGPDTGNSQWFVNLSPQPHLDGTYTVFGRVVRGPGLSALQAITQGDRITRVRVSVH